MLDAISHIDLQYSKHYTHINSHIIYIYMKRGCNNKIDEIFIKTKGDLNHEMVHTIMCSYLQSPCHASWLPIIFHEDKMHLLYLIFLFILLSKILLNWGLLSPIFCFFSFFLFIAIYIYLYCMIIKYKPKGPMGKKYKEKEVIKWSLWYM